MYTIYKDIKSVLKCHLGDILHILCNLLYNLFVELDIITTFTSTQKNNIMKTTFEKYNSQILKIKLDWYYNKGFKKDWHKDQALIIIEILKDRNEL